MKPDIQNIELRSTPKGLTAWCNGRFLGWADVVGTEVTIRTQIRRVQAVVLPDCGPEGLEAKEQWLSL